MAIRIIDISNRVRAKQRMRNGLKASVCLGIAFLAIGIFTTVVSIVESSAEERTWIGGALMLSLSATWFAISLGFKKENRIVAAISGALLLALIGISPTSWFFVLPFGFFLLQGIQGTFAYHRALSITGGWTVKKLHKPRRFGLFSKVNAPTILLFFFLAMIASVVGIGLVVFVKPKFMWPRYLKDLAGFGLNALAVKFYILGKRHSALGATALRKRDSRRPILLLRSFRDDMSVIKNGLGFLGFYRPVTFEEVFTTELWKYGPVIAVGRPGEPLPPIGAAREYVSNETWQQEIDQLSAESQMIVIILGKTEGIQWELRRMIDRKLLRRVILLFSIVPKEDLRERWNKVVELMNVQADFPIELEKILMVTFSDGDGISCFTARHRDEQYYEEGLVLAREGIVRGLAS